MTARARLPLALLTVGLIASTSPDVTPGASSAVVAPPGQSTEELVRWMTAQARVSHHLMMLEVSPHEPKEPNGPAPLPGVVVAALSKRDPDYYFHWVRDSAEVMRTFVEELRARREVVSGAEFDDVMGDFLRLSERLQKLPAPFGLGEPRYTVDGKVDRSPWSRPQLDGPARRALTVLAYLKVSTNPDDRERARRVLMADLTYTAASWKLPCFDLWEEVKANNYDTRLVQFAALTQGAAWWRSQGGLKEALESWESAARALAGALDAHWDPERGYLRSQLGTVGTDGYTKKQTDLDSAVVVAVLDADLEGSAHSVLDDRVQATVAALEGAFRTAYPINRDSEVGLAYGRYVGDSYFGGNPWYLITANFAQFYYRLAQRLQAGAAFTVSSRNLHFTASALGLDPDQLPLRTISPVDPLHPRLIQAFRAKGDAIMQRLRRHTPADGQLYEQIDRVTGNPVSARGLAWAHSAFIAAVLAR